MRTRMHRSRKDMGCNFDTSSYELEEQERFPLDFAIGQGHVKAYLSSTIPFPFIHNAGASDAMPQAGANWFGSVTAELYEFLPQE